MKQNDYEKTVNNFFMKFGLEVNRLMISFNDQNFIYQCKKREFDD